MVAESQKNKEFYSSSSLLRAENFQRVKRKKKRPSDADNEKVRTNSRADIGNVDISLMIYENSKFSWRKRNWNQQ